METYLNHETVPVIVLAAQPRIFREVLRRALENNPKVPLVLEAENMRRLSQILNTINTRWLFITTEEDNGLPVDVAALLHRHPSLSIASISLDGAEIEIYEIENEKYDERILRHRHEDLSLADVLHIVDGTYSTMTGDSTQH